MEYIARITEFLSRCDRVIKQQEDLRKEGLALAAEVLRQTGEVINPTTITDEILEQDLLCGDDFIEGHIDAQTHYGYLQKVYLGSRGQIVAQGIVPRGSKSHPFLMWEDDFENTYDILRFIERHALK